MALLSSFFVLDCSFVNKVEVCEEANPTELRVNNRGDTYEFPYGAGSAAEIAGGRVMVAFVAQDDALTQSEVRLTMLNAAGGARFVVCSSADVELTMSPAGVLAFAPQVARADMIVDGAATAAAVLWTQGSSTAEWQTFIRFVDSGGCPVGAGAVPLDQGVGFPTWATAARWSPLTQSVALAYTDGKRVLFSRYLTSILAPVTLAEEFAVARTSLAVGPDGGMLVAWAGFTDDVSNATGKLRIRAALLDPVGNFRPAALAGGAAAPFEIPLPASYAPDTGGVTIAVAASQDRFALVADPAPSPEARRATYVVELAASDGALLYPARRVDPTTGAAHGSGAAVYAPNGSLVVTWESGHSNGTLATVLDSTGAPRFNTITCDETPFSVGTRNQAAIGGWPAPLMVGGDVWIVHDAQPAYDPVGTGVLAWRMPFSELWPGGR